MQIEQYELTAERRAAWDRFVDASNNGTLFHKLAFLNYHPEGRFDFHHLAFRNESGKLRAVLPAHIRQHDEGRQFLVSPAGASIGGPVVAEGMKTEEYEELVTLLKRYGREQDLDLQLRLGPREYMNIPDETLSFWLHADGFQLTRRWLLLMVPLPWIAGGDSVLSTFSKGKRRDVRAGLRDSIEAKEVPLDQLDTFYDILMQNQGRMGSNPTHTLDELKRLVQLVPDHLRLFFSYWHDQPLAATLLFKLNSRIVTTFYVCQTDEHMDRLTMPVLFAEIIRSFHAEGYRYLDLGPVTFDDYSLNTGLSFFKQGFGARGYPRDMWSLPVHSQ